jgi:ribulose-5-phosphate 4-epimerase/fuculose-1-phosphate aldolase
MNAREDLRRALVRAGRVLAHEGQGDYVAGHVSVRAGAGAMFMKPAGIGLEEMSPSNVIEVDFDGERIAGAFPRHNEVFIHTEVYKARPDVNAVVHTHPVHAVVFSSLGTPLLPLSADATIFGDIAVFDETTDLIITADRGAAVARRLGEDMALILRNHGIVAVGASVEEAVYYALKLEQACRVQLMAAWAGGARLHGSPGDSARRGARNRRPDLFRNVFDYVDRCACRAAGIGLCEPISPEAMVGRQTAEP